MALLSKIKPKNIRYGLGIEELDQEGRVITAEFDDFYVLNSYTPNSGMNGTRLDYRVDEWDKSFR